LLIGAPLEAQVSAIGIGTTADIPKADLDRIDNTDGSQLVQSAEQLSAALDEAFNATFAANPGSDIVDAGGGDDFTFGDSGIAGLATRVAAATGISNPSDADILRYISEHPDVVASWPGADNSQTDPQTGASLDKADVLIGNNGSDILFAQGGDDVLFGDASLDAVAGWLNLSGSDRTVANMANAIDGMDIVTLKAGLAGLETAEDGDDMLFGGDGDDWLFGLGGDDEMFGGSGNDMLLGGSGDDKLYGGDSGTGEDFGADYLDGGDGEDTIDGGAGTDIIRFDSADTIDGGADIDILLGNVNDGSLKDLTKVSNVEIFLKAADGSDIDLRNLIDLDKLDAIGLYVDPEGGNEVTLTEHEQYTWQVTETNAETGITTITCWDTLPEPDVAVLTLETTLEVEQAANEIILTHL
jgi:Ca2+-binding RTX toxin-like protein